MVQSTLGLDSSVQIAMTTIPSLRPSVTPMNMNRTITESTTLISVSTGEILSTITKAAGPATYPQATITVEITTQLTAPQAQTLSSSIQSSETTSPTPPSASGTGTQAGVNIPSNEEQPASSPVFQGGQSNPTLQPTITQPSVGPFSPVAALLGGVPNKNVDVPITAVFLVLFIIGAASHFIRHEVNSKRGHKFFISDMLFDFCMVRNVTCVMRIVWAFRSANNSIVVAALIFENAGVVVLYAVNIIFTQRIIRAIHPKFGWHRITSKFFLLIIISVPFIIFWNIISLTLSFFTLNPRSLEITKRLLLFGSCWTLFLSLFPTLFVTLFTSIPYPTPAEKFGQGRFRVQCIILISASALLVIGAITRLLAAVVEKPINAPSHLFSKPVFYTTGFMLEILVVYGYLFLRIDLRFWVPNGTGGLIAAGGPGSYTVKSEDDEEKLANGDDAKLRATSNLPRTFLEMS